MGMKCNYKNEFKKYRDDIRKGCYKSYSKQFKFFYEEYTKEMNENPEFDFSNERSMLQFKVNNKYESALSIYISGIIAILLFCGSTVIGNKIVVYSAIIMAFILTLVCIIELLKANMLSDMWNIALIALETLERENEERKVNELVQKIKKSLEGTEEITVNIERIKQFLVIK